MFEEKEDVSCAAVAGRSTEEQVRSAAAQFDIDPGGVESLHRVEVKWTFDSLGQDATEFRGSMLGLPEDGAHQGVVGVRGHTAEDVGDRWR